MRCSARRTVCIPGILLRNAASASYRALDVIGGAKQNKKNRAELTLMKAVTARARRLDDPGPGPVPGPQQTLSECPCPCPCPCLCLCRAWEPSWCECEWCEEQPRVDSAVVDDSDSVGDNGMTISISAASASKISLGFRSVSRSVGRQVQGREDG